MKLIRADAVPTVFTMMLTAVIFAGCGTTKEKSDDKFFTSGSREADQRASQRMAKAEQLEVSGEKDKNRKEDEKSEGKRSLYDRLGGDEGIMKIVDDFYARASADPRVNWQRKEIKRGGFSLSRDRSVTWNATPENTTRLKKHLAQFFSLATGGPTTYGGKDMKSTHADLRITNAEFDAAVGDLKASLDKLQIANQEQKELLAIVESTRAQIVTER